LSPLWHTATDNAESAAENQQVDTTEAQIACSPGETAMKDTAAARDTMAREELGLDPDELGSPWSATFSSLIAFGVGAVAVALPYIFGSGLAAMITAIVLAAFALFGIGATIGMINGRSTLRAGARQLMVGWLR
jgi:VIT1/CCC1 family predicted Fe2+/Mn2+ transporter